jgi:hypothetical protein
MAKKNFFLPTIPKIIASLICFFVIYFSLPYTLGSCMPIISTSSHLPILTTENDTINPSSTPQSLQYSSVPCGKFSYLLETLGDKIPYFYFLIPIILAYFCGSTIGYFLEKPRAKQQTKKKGKK